MSDTFTEGHLERARQFLDHAGVPPGAVDTNLAQLLAQVEHDARLAPGANHPPSPIDPERLIDVASLPGLLALNYGPLTARAPELEAERKKWLATHLVPAPADWPAGKPYPERYEIRDGADNNEASEHFKLLASFTGGKPDAKGGLPTSGEAYEVRAKITKPLRDGAALVIKWCDDMRTGLCSHLDLIDRLQKDYIRTQEAKERQRLATIAEAEKAAAARALAAAAAPNATEGEMLGAFQAEQRAEETQAMVTAPRNELMRSTGSLGVTTSTRGKIVVTPIPEDLILLVKAVAEGKQPITFLTFNLKNIEAQAKDKIAPLKKCPGVTITEDFGIARRAG